MPTKILFYGAGAICSIYVYLLQKAGCEVTVVCRSNYNAVKEHGFIINSARYGQNLQVQPNVVRTIDEAAETQGVFDFLIVTTKAFPEDRASDKISTVVTRGKTTICLIQNGVGIEDEYATAFPDNPLLSCVVYLSTTQVAPGKIEMGPREQLEIGTFPASSYEDPNTRHAANTFVNQLKQAGSNVTFHEDIQAKRWTKLLLNSSWNPICALTLSRDAAFLASSDNAQNLTNGVMTEIMSIAQALGHTSVTKGIIDEQMKQARGRIGGRGIQPSMLDDVLNARRMEVEVILGNPLRIAQKLEVSTPRLEVLYVLAKALDQALSLRSPGQALCGDQLTA